MKGAHAHFNAISYGSNTYAVLASDLAGIEKASSGGNSLSGKCPSAGNAPVHTSIPSWKQCRIWESSCFRVNNVLRADTAAGFRP